MGQTKVSARWTGESLHYVGVDSRGNQVIMGGRNIPPSQMMLMGLAGCMGMDVLSILQKKKQNVTDVTVDVTGHNPDTHPKPYHTVELTFNVKGTNVNPKAVERSIELSVTKYCIVGQTLKSPVNIQTVFKIDESEFMPYPEAASSPSLSIRGGK